MQSIDYETIFDYAAQQVKERNISSEKQSNELQQLAEDIFNLYCKDAFSHHTIDIQGHLRGVIDNRPMADFEDKRLWKKFKSRYVNDIERYLLNPLSSGKFGKDKIIPFFSHGINMPRWMDDIYCVDCGCNIRVKKIGNVYTNDLPEDEEEFWVYVKQAQSACKFPNGVGHYSNLLKVPSGKLIFSNNLLSLFDRELAVVSDEYISKISGYNNTITSDYGVQLNTQFWNEKKVIYIQVGNTSPTLYKNPNTHEITCKINGPVKDGIEKGKIDTAVWAVFGMDYNEFIKLCKLNGKDIDNIEDEFKPVIIDVPAGKYEVTSYNAAKYSDQDTFFTINKVN